VAFRPTAEPFYQAAELLSQTVRVASQTVRVASQAVRVTSQVAELPGQTAFSVKNTPFWFGSTAKAEQTLAKQCFMPKNRRSSLFQRGAAFLIKDTAEKAPLCLRVADQNSRQKNQ
jgi:hypothetical protein